MTLPPTLAGVVDYRDHNALYAGGDARPILQVAQGSLVINSTMVAIANQLNTQLTAPNAEGDGAYFPANTVLTAGAGSVTQYQLRIRAWVLCTVAATVTTPTLAVGYRQRATDNGATAVSAYTSPSPATVVLGVALNQWTYYDSDWFNPGFTGVDSWLDFGIKLGAAAITSAGTFNARFIALARAA